MAKEKRPQISHLNQPASKWPVVRLFLLLFLLPALILTGGSTLLYQKERTDEMKQTRQTMDDHINHERQTIENALGLIASDLFVLANHHALAEVIKNRGSDKYYPVLQQEFLDFARYKEIYDQIRLIDASGQELLRINYNNGNATAIPKSALQNKSDRYYFKETMELSKNDIYISPFDLNMEHGLVETPRKPVIRIATPVIDRRGTRHGIIVLNYLGHNLLGMMGRLNKSQTSVAMLLNSDGYWLKSLRPEDEWGFMFADGHGKTMAVYYPQAWAALQRSESHYLSDEGLFTFDKVFPLKYLQPANFTVAAPHKSRLWYVAFFIPASELFPLSSRLSERLIWINLAALLLWALVSWSLAHTTHRKRLAEAALMENAMRMQEVVKTVFDGIITTNGTGIIRSFNPAACRIFGYQEEEVIGQHINLLIPEEYFSGHDYDITRVQVQLKGPREVNGLRKDGTSFPMAIGIAAKQKDGKWLITAVCRDITEQKQLQDKLKHMAITDELTGLHNRFYLNERLHQSFRHAVRYRMPLSLMVLDVDNFKSINDQHGHGAGDAYLASFAKLLTDSCRDTDTICRYGGEEFVIMLPETSLEQAEQLATRLLKATRQMQVMHDDTVITTTTSIGISNLEPESMENEEELVKQADAALYRAKRAGKNRYISN